MPDYMNELFKKIKEPNKKELEKEFKSDNAKPVETQKPKKSFTESDLFVEQRPKENIQQSTQEESEMPEGEQENASQQETDSQYENDSQGSLFDQIKTKPLPDDFSTGEEIEPKIAPEKINAMEQAVADAKKDVQEKQTQHQTATPTQQVVAETDFSKAPEPQKPIIIEKQVINEKEIRDKIEQMEKELPPQDTSIKTKETEEYIKSQAEKELENSKKEEIDSYGDVKIYRIPGQPLLYYWIPIARPIGTEKTIINTIKEAATRIISITPYKIRDQEQKRNVYYQKVMEILRDSPELHIPKTRYKFYAESVVREMVGYGLIDSLIKDDQLEEIMVIGPKLPVYVFHRKHEMMITNIEFYSDKEIQDLLNRIARQVGRRVDLSSPLLDARLPDGSRVNATIPPASVQGSTLTIRKFKEDPLTIIDMINLKSITPEVAAFLWICTEGMQTRPANILIAGGTGSGKTTTLNILASFIQATERVISIEDTAELNLPLKHWIRMESKPPGLEGTGELTMDILTKNSLRMRPDRVIVGEIRHDEAFTLFTAFNTGHDGSMGTVHANTPEETVVRVTSPPMSVPEVMLSALDLIIIQQRLHDKKMGTIRRITEIAQISGVLKGKTKVENIFERNPAKDKLEKTKTIVKYFEILEGLTGLSKKQIEDELKKRESFLAKLAKNNVRDMFTVSKELEKFLNPKSE